MESKAASKAKQTVGDMMRFFSYIYIYICVYIAIYCIANKNSNIIFYLFLMDLCFTEKTNKHITNKNIILDS